MKLIIRIYLLFSLLIIDRLKKLMRGDCVHISVQRLSLYNDNRGVCLSLYKAKNDQLEHELRSYQDSRYYRRRLFSPRKVKKTDKRVVHEVKSRDRIEENRRGC